jgi:hypothetical protein
MPDAHLTRFGELAKASKWSQADADAFVAEQIAVRREASTMLLNELKANSEVGGDKLAVTQQAIGAFVDRWLPKTDPLRAAWDTNVTALGYANFTPLVVMLARAAASLQEDRPPIGQQPAAEGSVPGSDRLWPGGGKAAQQKQAKA